MYKFKNKLIGSILAGAMILTPITYLQSADTNIAHAAESKALRDAKAKIGHLTSSLKTNYLGIKNQGTWQLYIKQARDLISKIPSSEKKQRDALTTEVNQDEALVNGLARINQVEKSIQPKSEGGYGNYLGIKNAETWNEYLRLAKIDLEKVNKSIFKKQYDELISRMNKVSLIVKGIEDKYLVEYNRIIKIFEEAKITDDLEKGKVALAEAEVLGSCDRTYKLKKDIGVFLYETPREKVMGSSDKGKVGIDIAPGRYIVHGVSGDPWVTISYDLDTGFSGAHEHLLTSQPSKYEGVNTYTVDLYKGQSVSVSYQDKIKLTPFKGNRIPSNILTTGTWEVGLDIEPGNYMVSITEGAEENSVATYGHVKVFRNGYLVLAEYLNDKLEWERNGLKAYSIELKKGDKIFISRIPSITYTKKVG